MSANKKRVAVAIGASAEAVYAIKQAQTLGFCTVAMDANPAAPGLSAADHQLVTDLRYAEQVCLSLEKEQLIPSVVIPVPVGRILTTAGAVNNHFHLSGVSADAAALVTDKCRFHLALAEAGLRDAQLTLLQTGTTALPAEMKDPNRYPLIIKPRYGAGSRGVRRCETEAEAAAALWAEDQSPLTEDYIAETCVTGMEYGVDGVYENGRFHLILLRQKRQTPPPYCQCVGYRAVVPGASQETDRLLAAIRDLMTQAGQILGLSTCPVHADVLADEQNLLSSRPFLIELSARPSGHHLHDLFTPMASGCDFITEYMKCAVPELALPWHFDVNNVRPLEIRYFDLPAGIVRAIPSPQDLRQLPGLVHYDCTLQPGQILTPVHEGHDLMDRGCYICEEIAPGCTERLNRFIRNSFLIESSQEAYL
ncbi:MAG: ATP-grasp domain-containing protein [Butyrivibrio sp.]|nr:ATP-grasp domain-containing protein [Butyrivibrio sp.]